VALAWNGEWLKAGSGAFVYGRREIAHGFKLIGEGSPPDIERCMILAERHGIEIHGPRPEAPAGFGR